MRKTIKKVVCIKSSFAYTKKGFIYDVVDESEYEYSLMCYELVTNRIVYPWVNKNKFKNLENDNI